MNMFDSTRCRSEQLAYQDRRLEMLFWTMMLIDSDVAGLER